MNGKRNNLPGFTAETSLHQASGRYQQSMVKPRRQVGICLPALRFEA
jgi:hypothetical protein